MADVTQTGGCPTQLVATGFTDGVMARILLTDGRTWASFYLYPGHYTSVPFNLLFSPIRLTWESGAASGSSVLVRDCQPATDTAAPGEVGLGSAPLVLALMAAAFIQAVRRLRKEHR